LLTVARRRWERPAGLPLRARAWPRIRPLERRDVLDIQGRPGPARPSSPVSPVA